MKHSFSLTFLLLALILLSCVMLKKSKVKSHMFPTARDVAKEYYLQNTVNHMVANNYVKSDIDNYPSRYTILNGLPEDKDPNMIRGEINPDDPNPYYPYYDPSKHTSKPEHKNIKRPAHSFYDIYPGDTRPYYGPDNNYRILDSTPNNGIKVDIKMGDLTSTFASPESIAELQQQLDHLDYIARSPKKLIANQQGAEVYPSDPYAYYDPTVSDLNDKKELLVKNLETMKKEYAYNQMVNQTLSNLPDIKRETAHIMVQNKINADKEEQNNYMIDGFYYPQPPEQQSQVKKPARVAANVIKGHGSASPRAESKNKKDTPKPAKRIPDTQGLKSENVRIIPFRKLKIMQH